MSLSAISVAAPLCAPWLDPSAARAGTEIAGDAPATYRTVTIVRPKPQPGETPEFLRSIIDDFHLSGRPELEILRDHAAEEAELLRLQGRIDFKGKSDADRKAERDEHRASVCEVRREIFSERNATRDSVQDEIRRAHLESARMHGDLRIALALESADSRNATFERTQTRVNDRLDQDYNWRFEEETSESLGLFKYAESSFGDQFELSWQSQAIGGSAGSADSSHASPATGKSSNWIG